MLTVEGRLLTDLPSTDPARLEYERLANILKRDYADSPIIIKTNRKRVEYENGVVEEPNSVWLPTVTAYKPDTSLYEMRWRWYPSAMEYNNPMASKWYEFKGETIYIEPRNRDFAIFLMFMLRDGNGRSFYGNEYEVFSSKKADTAIADSIRAQADLQFYIYGDNEISKDTKRLIKIGQSLGMANFKYDEVYMNEDSIKNRIYEYIVDGENLGIEGRDIKAFVNAISAYVETDLRSFVQECFDSGILVMEDNNEIYIVEGKKSEFLIRVSDIGTSEYISAVSNFLKTSQAKRNKLESILGKSAYTGGSYEWEDIKGATPRMLDAILKDLKIKMKDATPEDKRNKICEVLGIQPDA